MKRGLKPALPPADASRAGPRTCPDEEGIETTREGVGRSLSSGVRGRAPMKRGLKLEAALGTQGTKVSPRTCPDEEGIETCWGDYFSSNLVMSADVPR